MTKQIEVRKTPAPKKKKGTAGESIYRPLIEQLVKLKVGEQLVVRPPKDISPGAYRNRLAGIARKQAAPLMRAGASFSSYVTEDDRVAVTREA